MSEKHSNIEKQLLQIKYGSLFKISDFQTVDDARRHIDEYVAKMPQYDQKALETKQKEIAEAEKNTDQKRDVADQKGKFEGMVSAYDDYCSRCIPQALDGINGYTCEMIDGKFGPVASALPPKETAEICYGFLQECIKAGLNTPDGKHPSENIYKLKTPYEKLPLATRMKYKMDKRLKRTPDAKVDLMAQCNHICQNTRKLVGSGDTFGYYFRNKENNEYMQKLANKPYTEMIETFKQDHAPASEAYNAALENVNTAANNTKQLNMQLNAMNEDNANAVAVRGAMEDKVDHYVKVHRHEDKARKDLAKRGLMTNDEFDGTRVHPSVAVNRQADAAARGEKMSWQEALRRKQSTRI